MSDTPRCQAYTLKGDRCKNRCFRGEKSRVRKGTWLLPPSDRFCGEHTWLHRHAEQHQRWLQHMFGPHWEEISDGNPRPPTLGVTVRVGGIRTCTGILVRRRQTKKTDSVGPAGRTWG